MTLFFFLFQYFPPFLIFAATSVPSIFSNDGEHARQSEPALFEASGDIADDDLYLPPGADVVLKPTDVEGAADKEDYDDLLK